MTYTEFAEAQMEHLAEAYLSNRRMEILHRVSDGLSLAGDAAVKTAAEVVALVRKAIEQNPGRYLPRRCCANCWGPCGQLFHNLEHGLCDSHGHIRGYDCGSFESAKDLGRRPMIINRSNRSRQSGTYVQEEVIQIEPDLVRIRRTLRNSNSGRVLKTRSFDRLYVGDTSKFIRRLVKVMRNSPDIRRVFHSHSYQIPTDLRITKHGIPLIKGETLEQYRDRVAAEVRKQLVASSKESYDMKYDDAVKFVCGALTDAENNVRKACSSFEEFLTYAFPGMSVWQVVEMLKQEPLLAE